jgi:hypothetical protein
LSASVRSEIVDFLRRELIGPDPGLPAQQLNREEILRPQDPPRLRYSAGVLFPRKVSVAVAESASEAEAELDDSDLSEADELKNDDTGLGDPRADARGEGETPTDQEVNRANEYLPSAMGISALVRVPDCLTISIAAAVYIRERIPGLGRTDVNGKWQEHWLRRPIESTFQIDCAELKLKKTVIKQFPVKNGETDTSLRLHVFSRPHFRSQSPDSDRIITFTLLNNQISQSQRPRDEECFFQCRLEVGSPSGNASFLEYPDRFGASGDDEEQSSNLLFSDVKTFAIGHGCAANWEGRGTHAASRIHTESLPLREIKPIVPTRFDGLDLSMLALSVPGDASLNLCAQLADSYELWISDKELEIDDLPDEHRQAARRHLRGCRDALHRIRSGISLLDTDDIVARAFSFMNRAMLEQQVHYDLASNPEKQRKWIRQNDSLVLDRAYIVPDLTQLPAKRGRWHPFQLAFILMNLRAEVKQKRTWD